MANEQTAKEYLRRYWSAILEIKRLKEELAELYDINIGLDIDSKKPHVQSSGTSDATGDMVMKITDLKEEIYNKMDAAMTILADTEETINKVTDADMRSVLTRRYVRRQKWEEIATEMYYSLRKVYNIHEAALVAVAEIVQ